MKKIKGLRMYRRSGACLSTIFVMFIAFVMAGITSAFIYFSSLPPISQLKQYEPTLLSQVVSSDDVVIRTFGSYKYRKVSINDIPTNLKEAIIATEDKNFYHHRGFDIIALMRSVVKNVKAKRMAQGASTITQQLARILFLSQEKTIDRKIKELVIAYRLEKTLPKDEILEMYLNNVYLGEGAYGVAAASEIYFNKEVEDLKLEEAALIAGLPQAPSAYSPYQNMQYARERRAMVLGRMLAEGFITQEEYETANNSPIRVNSNRKPYSQNKAPYFTDYVLEELKEKVGMTEQEVIQGGYKIYTTLNYSYQKAAERGMNANLAKWNLRRPYQQAALVSFDVVDGKILAYIGGKDYQRSQFDRVRLAIRQPGSSFKPFVYAAAVERGYNPTQIVHDAPTRIGNWAPRNYNNKYRGSIPLWKALAVSSNSISVQLIKAVGVDAVRDMARRLGINTPIVHDPTIALGSCGVKLFEITNAYGVFANGGVKVQPYAVDRIETSTGKVIYQATPNSRRVMDIRSVSYMVEMLKKVVEQGTAKVAQIGVPAAGKTGTTDSYRDAWFVGFTPNVVTGVWVGNDNNTPNGGITGGTAPASIWKEYMAFVEGGKKDSKFVYPEIIMDNKTAGNTTESSSGQNAEEEIDDLPQAKPQQISDNEQPVRDDESLAPPLPQRQPESQTSTPPVYNRERSQSTQQQSPPTPPVPTPQYGGF